MGLLLPGVFLGFLAFGYNLLTIAISTLVMFVWYVAVWQWWRRSRGLRGLDFAFLRAGFAYLVASSLGIWSLAFLQATGKGTALSEALVIHAFLLGFTWFMVLSIIGLILARSSRLGLVLDHSRLRRALFWWVPLAIVTFPLGVVGGPEVEWLGPPARVAGIALLYPAWLLVSTLWAGASAGPLCFSWRVVAGWFAGAAATTATAGVLGSGVLLAAGRQGVVIYLHVLLVGFVSTSLFALLTDRTSGRVLGAHHLALGVMVIGLTVAALGWTQPGFWVAALGSAILWLAGLGWVVART